MSSESCSHRRIWWLLLAVPILAVVMVWSFRSDGAIHPIRVLTTAAVLLLGSTSFLLWVTLSRRITVKARLAVWGIFLAAVASIFTGFSYRGVTGDLVPVFEPRWRGGGRRLTGEGGVETARYSYPQFLGPRRNATVQGVRLDRDWSARPPKLVWRRPVGKGWSGFAVVGDKAITQEQHGEEERVVCYDLRTAEIRWHSTQRASYTSSLAGDGPRATPTVFEGRVYALGATGHLQALDLESGRRIWSRNILEDNAATGPPWGMSGSPLVVDGLVVVSAGGASGKSLVAYDVDGGAIVWRGGDDRSAYASALITTLGGVRQIVILNERSVAGHDPVDGHVLWSHPWPGGQPSVAQPVPLPGDRLLVSAGYGVGSKLFAIDASPSGQLRARPVWESPRLKAKFTNVVFHDGFIYGLDDGILVCLDPETGDLRWKRGRYGHGQVILVEDLLLVQTEMGEMVLVEPIPEEHRELSRFRVVEGKIWNSPALAGPYLLVRTEREAALYELPLLEEDGAS